MYKYMTICLVAFLLSGCDRADVPEKPVTKAQVTLSPTEGNSVSGVVTFEKVDDGVRITANIKGLKPGKHGFHIHEYGDCSAKDGSSAGGHYNPLKSRHGAPTVVDRHAGDFGNITADHEGNATYERVDAVVRLNGKQSIIGRSFIVHANADDLISQPSGNAGKRLACGVIERLD